MARAASLVVAVLLLVLLRDEWSATRDGPAPADTRARAEGLDDDDAGVVDGADADSDEDDAAFARRMRECDLLCKRFDATHDETLCTRLRDECQLPCAMDQRFLDVVYLWANGSDVLYQQEQERIRKTLVGKPEWRTCFKQATSARRSREMGIFRRFKHLRRVFIITPLGQVPTFLRRRHPRVRIVDTHELVPIEEPSFNSNAIQFQMHRIPTVSDPFVTMNDDFLMLKNQTLDTFVHPVDGRMHYPIDYYPTGAMGGCWGIMVKRTVKMYEFQPAKQQLFIAAHQPLAITQIVARSIARMYAKELALVTQHVFRNSQDPTFDSLHIWVGNEMKFGVTETIAFECKGTFGMMDKTKMDDVLTALQSPPVCLSLALNDDFDVDTPAKLIDNVNVLLEGTFPHPSPVEAPWQAAAQRRFLEYECAFSGASVRIPVDAFFIPEHLYAWHNKARYRGRVGQNKRGLPAKQLYSMFSRKLDAIDASNGIAAPSQAPQQHVLAAQWHAHRGRTWCEAALCARSHPALGRSDFWLVSGQDLGMARSKNVYTARRLAYGLGYNYVWAPEFYETNQGSHAERVATLYQTNTWGLHGNAILSRWQLQRPSLVKLPDSFALFDSHVEEAGERRLGERHALLAEAAVNVTGSSGSGSGGTARITVAVLETLPHAGLDTAHGTRVVQLLRAAIQSYGNRLVIVGGTLWPGLCEALGLTPSMRGPVEVNQVSATEGLALGPKVLRDQVCYSSAFSGGNAFVFPGGFTDARSQAPQVLSQHPFLLARLKLRDQ